MLPSSDGSLEVLLIQMRLGRVHTLQTLGKAGMDDGVKGIKRAQRGNAR